jgi:3-(3-hydroxy-phenyl)propionate hydroxylase
MSSHRVIVVGAGPAGLVTALALARNNIPVVVLEAHASPQEDLRATTFHPPTLSMLDRFGITTELIARGHTSPKWQFRDRAAGKVAEFDLSLLSDVSPHPYRLQCEQFILTEVLRRELAKWACAALVFGATVAEVTQDAHGVTASWRDKDGLAKISGSFLVAADGARSTVRKLIPVTFDGFTYDERIIQAGTSFDFRTAVPDLADVNYIADPVEWCVLLLIAGYWRVSFPIGPGENEEEAISEKAFRRRLKAICEKAEISDLTHRKCWRIHQRVASSFRHGRIILVGDAAHINSPHGGMGMNSAIHDAVNLAKKLSDVCLNGRNMDVLDVYSRQRRFVALEDVRSQSMRNSRMMSERDPSVRAQSLERMRKIAEDRDLSRAFLLESSMMSGLQKAELIN